MVSRILLLTQWFDPEPTFKGLIFARALIDKGFDVEVVTGFPNYPGGKVYPGHKICLLQRDNMEGVNVTRLPLYPSHDSGVFGRILNYISFSISAVIYCIFFAKRPDVIYVYHPPLTVALVASIVRFFRRIPVVCDIQDLWPDTLRSTGMFTNERALRIVSYICDWVYSHVDKIVVLSPGFKRLLVERGVTGEKIDIIFNWCDEVALKRNRGRLPEGFRANDKFIILYAGNLGKAQGLWAVIEAASIVQDCAPNIEFVFVGSGLDLENLKSLATKRGLDNVRFLARVAIDEIGSYLTAADALLVHLRRDPLFVSTIPSKTQAYMAMGKPILMAVGGDAADVVRAARCGVVAESEDPGSIADGAIALMGCSRAALCEMASNGKNFYLDNFSMNVGVDKFARLLAELITQRTI